MKFKQKMITVLSTALLISQTFLPSAAVVYAETQNDVMSRAPDEALVFKKEDQVVSSKEDKDKLELQPNEETKLTLHRESNEMRDVTVEVPEELEFLEEKTVESNQEIAKDTTDYLRERANQETLRLQEQYNAEAEQEKQAVLKEFEEKIAQASQSGTVADETVSALELERDQKLASIQPRQTEIQQADTVEASKLVELRRKDESKQENHRLIFHFQEGQKEVHFIFQLKREGEFNLLATYEKDQLKYRSYPVRMQVKSQVSGEIPSHPEPASSSASSEISKSENEVKASSAEEENHQAVPRVEEGRKENATPLDKFISGFSRFFAAGSDRAAVTSADLQFDYQPTTKDIRSGETAVYNLTFSVSGALVEDVKNVDIDVEVFQPYSNGTLSNSPVMPLYFAEENLKKLEIAGVVPTYNEQSRTLHYHFDTLHPGQTGHTTIHIGTRNGTTINNTGIFPFSTLKVNGRTLKSVDNDHDPLTIRGENPKIIVNKNVISSHRDTSSGLWADPNGTVEWKIGATITTSNTGGMYLKPGQQIKIKDLPQDGQTIVGQQEWTFTAPSFEEQEKNLREKGYLWRQEVTAKTKVPANAGGKTVRNQAEVIAQSIREEISKKSQPEGVFVRRGGNKVQEPNGDFITGVNRGPGKDIGSGLAHDGKHPNENPTFDNTADLELNFEMTNAVFPFVNRPYIWNNVRGYKKVRFQDLDGRERIGVYFQSNLPDNEGIYVAGTVRRDANGKFINPSGTPDRNFSPFENQLKFLRLHQKVDDHLNVKKFNIFLPVQQSRLNEFQLGSLVNDRTGNQYPTVAIRMNVQHADGRTEAVFKEVDLTKYSIKDGSTFGWNGRPYVTVNAEDVGLSPTDHVKDFYIQYGDGSRDQMMYPWIWSAAVTTYSINDPKFSGTVENSTEISGEYYESGKVRAYERIPLDVYGDPHNSNMGPRNATIVVNPKLQPSARIVPKFKTSNGTLVQRGDNRLVVDMSNISPNNANIHSTIKNGILLPKGVTVKEQANPRYSEGLGSYTVVRNFQNTGRDLLVISYKTEKLEKDNTLSFEADVTISNDAPLDLTIDAYGGSTKDALVGIDPINNDGNATNFVQDTSVKNMTHGSNQYLLTEKEALKVVKYVRKIGESQWHTGQTDIVTVATGNDYEYKIAISNPSGGPIYRLGIMDVLPSVNDKTVLYNRDRLSKFTLSMKGPIRLPAAWQGKVTVKYSRSTNPNRDDLLNKGVYVGAFIKPSQPQNVENPNWLTEEQVQDWSSIHSFLIEYDNPNDGLSSDTQEFTYTMTVPENLTGIMKETIAWNSVAATLNNTVPVEPTRVGVRAEESSTTFNIRVKKVDNDTVNQALEARFEIYSVKDGKQSKIDHLNTNTRGDYHRIAKNQTVRKNEEKEYILREVTAPDRYLPMLEDIRFKVKGDKTVALVHANDLVSVEMMTEGSEINVNLLVRNQQTGSMKIHKVAANSNENLSGAVFKLATSEANARAGIFVKKVTRNEPWIPTGSTIKRVHVVDQDSPVFKNSNYAGYQAEDYSVTSDQNGIATFEYLDPRKNYYAVEVIAPEGYALDKTPLALTKDNSSDATAAIKTNSRPRVKFFVGKTDEAGNNLAGRFFLYHKSNLEHDIDHTNTDAHNPTQLHGSPLTLNPAGGQDYEDFVVRETVAPEGYLPMTNDIVIRAYSSGKAEILDKAKFLNSRGEPLFNNLTVADNHWWLSVENKTDNNGNPYYQFLVSLQNIAETAMKLKKVDATDGKMVLAGAKFALADSLENAKAGKFLKLVTRQVNWNSTTDKPQYSWEAASSVQDATIITTGNDGIVSFEHLDPLMTYYAVEVKAPNEYQLDQTPQALNKDTATKPLVFKNSKRGVFPRTGGIGMIAFVLIGLSLMVFASYGKKRYKPKH